MPKFTAIGELRRVCVADPRVVEQPGEVPFEWLDGRPVVRGTGSSVWVEVRRQVPRFEGDAWDATVTYDLGDQVWDATSGDYYRSLVPSNLNYPVTDTARWERVAFPYVLAEAVAQGAYADAVRADGRQELFVVENAEAARLLQTAMAENDRRGGTARRLAVSVR